MDVDEFAEHLALARWRFAGTMPQWPHVYTVRDWWSSADAFRDACRFIEAEGHVIPWPAAPAVAAYHNRYLILGAVKFWAMGPRGDQDRPGDRTVLNCAVAEPDEVARLGEVVSLNHTGAWSDLSTCLLGLIHKGSSHG